MTFHMPDGWYEPPREHDCPDDPDDCQCAERDADARDDTLIARQEERDGR